MTCKIEGCDKPRFGRGWCKTHYTRWLRHGDPEFVKRIQGDDDARFWSKVRKTDGCWLWTGTLHSEGYGGFLVEKKMGFAHRYSYELLVGPIPDGLHIDHLCRVRQCVNPAHLEPVTQAENNRRAIAAKTHCKWGHEWTPENTYVINGKRGVQRNCRICALARQEAKRRVSAI